VPGLLSKTVKRGESSRTALAVQERAVTVFLVLALCSLTAGMVWALSGTAMPDIFA